MKYQGLTDKEVTQRVNENKVNISNIDVSKSTKQIIKDRVFTYFNFLNLFLALLVLTTGRFLNLTFIGVVFVNTIIGIIQELKVKNMIDKLNIINTDKSKVIRNNKLVEILPEEIVIDDIIYFEIGDQIPVDIKVIESSKIEMNESLLTGESDSIKKEINDKIFAGTFLVSGSGYGKVIAVGDNNYSSQILSKAKKHKLVVSEMKLMIEKIIKVLSIVIIPVGLLLFRAQYINTSNISLSIVKTVGGVIGMIPEGLVLLTSLSFVLGVGRLAKKNALVQQMEAIESLARVDVLCLDKTGTITTGELKVKEVYPINNNIDIYKILGSYLYFSDVDNATNKALKKYFKKNNNYSYRDELPFNSERKYSAYKFNNNEVYVLGAADYLTSNENILNKVNEYSKLGYRVLSLGKTSDLNTIDKDIEILSLIIIEDIVKEDAIETFKFFDKENVNIKVISGDNPITVSKICKTVGIKGADKYIDARNLPEDIEEMKDVVNQYQVFGRVKPNQKELIIKALNKTHHTAMVGDGVNDVLAIKEASCGIAMANGASSAKASADIVLLDSNFSSMSEIVKEGRTIIGNIERVSSLYLTKTIYSTLLSLIFGLFGMLYPFIPFQLSIISGFAIGYPSFFITLEKDIKVNSKGFLSHVLHSALPSALTIVLNVTTFYIISKMFNIENKIFLSYSYLITLFISFIVLFIVLYPLNKKRSAIFITFTLLAYIVVFVLYKHLEIYPIYNSHLILVVPICIINIFVIMFLTRVIIFIKEKVKFINKTK